MCRVDTLILTCLLFLLNGFFTRKYLFLNDKNLVELKLVIIFEDSRSWTSSRIPQKFSLQVMNLNVWRKFTLERNFNLKKNLNILFTWKSKKITIFVENGRKIWINSWKYLGEVDYYQTDSASILKKIRGRKTVTCKYFERLIQLQNQALISNEQKVISVIATLRQCDIHEPLV